MAMAANPTGASHESGSDLWHRCRSRPAKINSAAAPRACIQPPVYTQLLDASRKCVVADTGSSSLGSPPIRTEPTTVTATNTRPQTPATAFQTRASIRLATIPPRPSRSNSPGPRPMAGHGCVPRMRDPGAPHDTHGFCLPRPPQSRSPNQGETAMSDPLLMPVVSEGFTLRTVGCRAALEYGPEAPVLCGKEPHSDRAVSQTHAAHWLAAGLLSGCSPGQSEARKWHRGSGGHSLSSSRTRRLTPPPGCHTRPAQSAEPPTLPSAGDERDAQVVRVVRVAGELEPVILSVSRPVAAFEVDLAAHQSTS